MPKKRRFHYGCGMGRDRHMFVPWPMPKTVRNAKVMFEAEKSKSRPVEEPEDILNDSVFNQNDQENPNVSMPNMTGLALSTPVKQEPEVKQEIVSGNNIPTSLPPLVNPTAQMDVDEESTACSVTLHTETRSPDSNFSNVDNTRSPTPIPSSPPRKVRRSARKACK